MKRKVKTKRNDTEDGSADKNNVTCAVCGKEFEKKSWNHHKQRYHNNLAWRVGDPPLDLNNMNLVKQILNALYAAKKPFYCDNCDKSVKSVNGFLSHKSVCGRSTEDARVDCPYCPRRLLPVSLPSHIRSCHDGKEKVEYVPRNKSSTIESGGKRRAAEKALKVIKNFNLETSGINTTHNVIVEDENQPEKETLPNVPRKDKRQNSINKRKTNSWEREKQSKYPLFLLPDDKAVDVIFKKAYEWTLQFCDHNYSTALSEEHFPCLKANWDYMDLNYAEEYLPKMSHSCDVGFETVVDFQDVLHKDHIFRKFELFESYLENNGNSTIFCGGPITALSWMPTPYDTDGIHQIVAVATKPHPDDQFETDVNYNEKCFIQFWDVGPLKNTDTSLFRPRQAFCLQFDHGPIWDLQWCPSNCYDLSDQPEDSEKLRRMGVLAVAGSDSYVYIYSIPNFKECGQFYNSRPVLILIRNVFEKEKLGGMDYYATRMSWTKASGHKFLAVGYSNGQVAIYNLFTSSNILRHKTNHNIDVLTPYTVLEAHCHSVTAIALHHSHDGCKWLMTGSFDRTVRTWDVQEKKCVRTIKGNMVNDAVWMTNWMCQIIAYDEASTTGNACSVIHQCKDGLSDPLYLFHCSSAITSISTSDWLNGIIQANSVGEIFATFPKQLMINLNWKKLKNRKLLFGYTTLVEKDKTIEERLKVNSEKEKALRNQLEVKTKIKKEELPSNREVMHLDYNPHYYEYEPLEYHEMDDKYGLIFCDHKMKKWSDFPPKLQQHMSHSSEKYSPSRPNMYPLQCINKIQFNMNRQASAYYISGYQAGFIRLTYMKFLDEDPFIVKDKIDLNK